MVKQSRRILIGALTTLATIILICVFNFGWFWNTRSALPRKEAALRYPYQQLNSREQALYGALCKGIENYDETIRLPGIYKKDEYERVYLMVAMQEPELFYLDSLYETADVMSEVNMIYSVQKDTVPVMRAQMEQAADRILKKAESASGDMQRLAIIHDEIASLCEYGSDSFQSEAYGCLVNGKAKCEGYSKALLYVARRGGINIMNVPGTIRNGENHVWNVAEINGQYYNIDLTWDDDEGYHGHTAHVCFAVPDSEFGDHRADLSMYRPPVCAENMHNYYQMNHLVIGQASELPAQVEQWPWDPSLIEFRLESQDVYKNVTNIISSSDDVREAVKSVSGAASYRAMMDENRMVLVIMPS